MCDGDLAREVGEVVVPGDEVGLAVDLDERADLAVEVDVAARRALGRCALAALGGLGLALHAQQLDRLLGVAVGLLERLLAVHHPRAGALAQRLHVAGGDRSLTCVSSVGRTSLLGGRCLVVGGVRCSALLRRGSACCGSGGLRRPPVRRPPRPPCAPAPRPRACACSSASVARLLLGLACAPSPRPRARAASSSARNALALLADRAADRLDDQLEERIASSLPGSRSRPAPGRSWCRPARSSGCRSRSASDARSPRP